MCTVLGDADTAITTTAYALPARSVETLLLLLPGLLAQPFAVIWPTAILLRGHTDSFDNAGYSSLTVVPIRCYGHNSRPFGQAHQIGQ